MIVTSKMKFDFAIYHDLFLPDGKLHDTNTYRFEFAPVLEGALSKGTTPFGKSLILITDKAGTT